MGIEVPVRLRSVETYLENVHGSRRELGVDELSVLDDYAHLIVQEIEDDWPVDTSTSRDAFAYTISGTRSFIGFTIENDVDYVEYIHRAGTPAEPPLYATLIPEVVAAHRDEMVAALKRAIDDTEERIAAEARKKDGLKQRTILTRSWRRSATPGKAA